MGRVVTRDGLGLCEWIVGESPDRQVGGMLNVIDLTCGLFIHIIF